MSAGDPVEDARRGLTPDEAREIAAHAMARVPEAVFRDILACLTTFDRRDDLAAIAAPALAIAGDVDQAAPPKTMRRMAEAMPAGRIVELSGGHFLPLERPREVAAAIAEFRREIAEGGA